MRRLLHRVDEGPEAVVTRIQGRYIGRWPADVQREVYRQRCWSAERVERGPERDVPPHDRVVELEPQRRLVVVVLLISFGPGFAAQRREKYWLSASDGA